MQDLNDAICEYITDNWIDTQKDSVKSFAANHGISENTTRLIKNSWIILFYF